MKNPFSLMLSWMEKALETGVEYTHEQYFVRDDHNLIIQADLLGLAVIGIKQGQRDFLEPVTALGKVHTSTNGKSMGYPWDFIREMEQAGLDNVKCCTWLQEHESFLYDTIQSIHTDKNQAPFLLLNPPINNIVEIVLHIEDVHHYQRDDIEAFLQRCAEQFEKDAQIDSLYA